MTYHAWYIVHVVKALSADDKYGSTETIRLTDAYPYDTRMARFLFQHTHTEIGYCIMVSEKQNA